MLTASLVCSVTDQHTRVFPVHLPFCFWFPSGHRGPLFFQDSFQSVLPGTSLAFPLKALS